MLRYLNVVSDLQALRVYAHAPRERLGILPCSALSIARLGDNEREPSALDAGMSTLGCGDCPSLLYGASR
jgi:hypothetical protein